MYSKLPPIWGVQKLCQHLLPLTVRSRAGSCAGRNHQSMLLCLLLLMYMYANTTVSTSIRRWPFWLKHWEFIFWLTWAQRVTTWHYLYPTFLAWRGKSTSLVWGKACETQKAAVETACKQNASQNSRQDPGCMGGCDFRDQNDAKRGRKRGRKSQPGMGESMQNQKPSNCSRMLVNNWCNIKAA